MGTAPKVTYDELEAEIASEHYFTAENGVAAAGGYCLPCPPPLKVVTFCVLVLRNGLTIVGVNYGPVDPANFNAEDGRKYARENAVEQLWPLLGFRLADRLATTARAAAVVGTIDGEAPGPVIELRD